MYQEPDIDFAGGYFPDSPQTKFEMLMEHLEGLLKNPWDSIRMRLNPGDNINTILFGITARGDQQGVKFETAFDYENGADYLYIRIKEKEDA